MIHQNIHAVVKIKAEPILKLQCGTFYRTIYVYIDDGCGNKEKIDITLFADKKEILEGFK